MAKTPEGEVKQKVREILERVQGLYYYMPVQAGFGRPSLDFIGSYRGFFFAIETKTEHKDPTPRQIETIRQIEASGGKVFVIRGVGDTQAYLQLARWLRDCMDHDHPRQPSTPETRTAL